MKASAGDRLVVDGDGDRVGLLTGVQHDDGTPPYAINWLSGIRIGLLSLGHAPG